MISIFVELIIIIVKTYKAPLQGLTGAVQYMHVQKKLTVTC